MPFTKIDDPFNKYIQIRLNSVINPQMSQERFSILQNGIDSRLEIICDHDTGFYNITKTAKMIAKLLKSDSSPKDDNNEYHASSGKCNKPSDFFKMASTDELIDECKQQTKLDKVHYELAKGTPKQFAGTYVHRLLYDHFLAWLDPRYAIKISIILDRIHQDANKKLLQEKDDAINRLEQAINTLKVDTQARDEAQSAEIQKLLSYAQNTTHQLSEVKDELSEARLDIQDGNDQIDKLSDKIEECRDVIIERMEEHTLNPQSITKRQYFTCLQSPEYCNVLYAIRSQMTNIKKQLKAHKNWDVMIEPMEDPNSIKMFNRFKDRVKSIETAWKTEIKLQYKQKEIDRETRDTKLQYIIDNPLISISRNDIEFDTDRIDIDQVLKLMKDTTFERFKLSVP
jgi:KilA-N domain/Protein of unknown function (DUF3627)